MNGVGVTREGKVELRDAGWSGFLERPIGTLTTGNVPRNECGGGDMTEHGKCIGGDESKARRELN
jgi:hypothetical protein